MQSGFLLRNLGCNPSQIHVLPDCVNTDVFKPAAMFEPAELTALRMRLGIPEDAKVIVYLGLLTEYQGTSHLLDAFRRILSKHQNVYLLLMGFPVAGYRQKSIELSIQDQVLMTGKISYEEAAIYLALGDVATAPKLSLTEGSGKLLNYMAAGIPTVAFDTPVAREYLGLNGIYAARGDSEDLARKLSDVLFPEVDEAENDTFYATMGVNLRKRAKQHFDWYSAGCQIEEIYGRITGRLPGEPAPNHWGQGAKAIGK